ncbi:trigger factor [Fusobacterium russii]|uniref:trigger factor n=1 Tax=Fusobacterium russii TaxID=854 RepID=UPI000399E642|nr:trigger factor [Fusobacterium russii]
MKYEVKRLEKSAVEVKIFLEKDELNPILDKILKKISENTEIPGFRKGKAPREAIINAHKEQISEEVAGEAINSNFIEIIEKEKIEPVSYVRIKNIDLKDTLEVTFDIDIYPEFEITNYKGLQVEKKTFEMTDERLNTEIEALLNTHSKLEEVTEATYKAELGDTVDLAFEGFMDGVAFDGGKAESHLLKLGSKSFIDTFEDQLVGYVKGQEGEITVKFPEEYHSAELAGKPAVFKVKINAIKKLVKPELNEDFAKTLSYESVEDLKTKKSEEITKREKDLIENEYTGKLLEEIAKNTTIGIPTSMINAEIDHRMRELEYQLSAQGFKVDDYLKMMGGNREMFATQMLPSAEMKVKTDLILAKIAKLENIEVSQEEVASKMEEVAKMYGMDVPKLETELKKYNNLENFKASLHTDIMMKKAIDVVVNNAK